MANVNAPNGFRPVRHLSGGVIRQNEGKIASGLGSNIFTGDLVVLKNDGYLDKAAAGDVNCIGVFAGVYWTDTDGTPRFEKRWPTGQTTLGSADAKAMIYDDPHIVYEAQVTGAALAQTHIGNNADILATAGSTTTAQSAHSIDLSSPGAGTAQIRIMGLVNRPDNELGNYARVECLINEHLFRAAAGI